MTRWSSFLSMISERRDVVESPDISKFPEISIAQRAQFVLWVLEDYKDVMLANLTKEERLILALALVDAY